MTVLKNKKIKPKLNKINKKSSSHSKCKRKIRDFQNIIQETILFVQKYKTLDIIEKGDLNICIQNLENVFVETNNISIVLNNKKKLIDYHNVGDRIQQIGAQLSENFRLYGTKNIENLLLIVFGNEFMDKFLIETNKHLWEVIKKYTHPISYKVMGWKKKILLIKMKKLNKNSQKIESLKILC